MLPRWFKYMWTIWGINDSTDYYHGCSYTPGQFLRQKEVSFDVLYYGALHVFYNFKHSLHIVKLSSVKSTIMARIPQCQAISPRLLDPWILIKLKVQYSKCLLYTNICTNKWCKFFQHKSKHKKWHRAWKTQMYPTKPSTLQVSNRQLNQNNRGRKHRYFMPPRALWNPEQNCWDAKKIKNFHGRGGKEPCGHCCE